MHRHHHHHRDTSPRPRRATDPSFLAPPRTLPPAPPSVPPAAARPRDAAGRSELARVLTRPGRSPPALASLGALIRRGGQRECPSLRATQAPGEELQKEGCHCLRGSISFSRVIISWDLHRKSWCSCYLYRQKTVLWKKFSQNHSSCLVNRPSHAKLIIGSRFLVIQITPNIEQEMQTFPMHFCKVSL